MDQLSESERAQLKKKYLFSIRILGSLFIGGGLILVMFDLYSVFFNHLIPFRKLQISFSLFLNAAFVILGWLLITTCRVVEKFSTTFK